MCVSNNVQTSVNNGAGKKWSLYALISQLYVAGLFVVVSWISFVVPPDVIPGRMALLITLFLVLVNIFNSVTTNTPKAEGKPV